MTKEIKLTEAERQYLADLMLREMKKLAEILGVDRAEKYLRKIDKAHTYDIYKKII